MAPPGSIPLWQSAVPNMSCWWEIFAAYQLLEGSPTGRRLNIGAGKVIPFEKERFIRCRKRIDKAVAKVQPCWMILFRSVANRLGRNRDPMDAFRTGPVRVRRGSTPFSTTIAAEQRGHRRRGHAIAIASSYLHLARRTRWRIADVSIITWVALARRRAVPRARQQPAPALAERRSVGLWHATLVPVQRRPVCAARVPGVRVMQL